MRVEPLPWDSDHFGLAIGRGVGEYTTSTEAVEEALAEAWQRGMDLVYVMGPSPEVVAPLGPHYTDEKVVFAKPIPAPAETTGEPVISLLGETATSDLLELAYQAGHSSRFLQDPRLSVERFRAMYRIWLEKSLSGERTVYVGGIRRGGRWVVFVTLEEDPTAKEVAHIGLYAVSEQVRGQGLGRRLLLAAEAWAYGAGFRTLKVATQRRNTGACHFYRAVNFTEESSIFIFHFWRPYGNETHSL